VNSVLVPRCTTGLTFDHTPFATVPDEPLTGPLPEDRKLVYPWIGFDLLQDEFEQRHNQDQIERTEDVLVGVRAGGRVGLALDSFGSDRDALVVSAYLQDGWNLSADTSLFASTTASGRIERDGLRNAVLSAQARYYAQTS